MFLETLGKRSPFKTVAVVVVVVLVVVAVVLFVIVVRSARQGCVYRGVGSDDVTADGRVTDGRRASAARSNLRVVAEPLQN